MPTSDLSATMSKSSSSSIDRSSSPPHHSDKGNSSPSCHDDDGNSGNDVAAITIHDNCSTNRNTAARKERPSRACATRGAARLLAAVAAEAVAEERRSRVSKKDSEEGSVQEDSQQCSSSKDVTQLVSSPPATQLPRWSLRSMWELASVLNFLHVFRPLLNINVEFSAEEFETALLVPNDTLSDIHIPLLKAIPPITRMALGRNTWVTVLCRKLRDWWQWVAHGEIPVVASHGLEIEAYNALDPGVRVVILKALCDIRVEQEDIRQYIEDSIKQGVQLSVFRKERVGGDSYGVSYWYENDPIVGHRLYRETRKAESKKVKTKGTQSWPAISYLWETVAANLDEFQDVSEKLCSSSNRSEISLGKKLKSEMLPVIEKVHKKKERLLKKQHREALLLDNFMVMDGLTTGRSLRDRKPVTYTFDDYDRSINEAIEVTKRKPPSPEPVGRREPGNSDALLNGRLTANKPKSASPDAGSPLHSEQDEIYEEQKPELLDRRRRHKSQRYSEKEFVEALSDEAGIASDDDDIVGEAVYDDEYLRKRKQMKQSSSSGGDDEYSWADENVEEDEDDDYISEESDDTPKFRKLPRRVTREKVRAFGETQAGLRRSRRATQTRINYRQYEMSDSEMESPNRENPDESGNHREEMDAPEHVDMNGKDGVEDADVGRRHFLDLNQIATSSGFDDGVDPAVRDDKD